MSQNDLPDAVLFCCTLNAIRSPMAEGIMKKLLGTKVYVDSVGARGSEMPDGFMVEVMKEIGVDMSNHVPKTFDELEDSYYDLIIPLSPEAQHHAVEMTRTMACDVEFWNTLDPSIIEGSRETRLQAYRQVRDQLMKKIKQRFDLE
ncbi:arsenate-mycothiol transferase ArsC [Aestuariispira ectoiniformans]|uniref:arsenate-mycothiol transferase ArsC n=1 Tax=Aestuariispira ectoiniformans TaxID=2775080 RepID=UPI00223AE67F|nr:low molecular weight phosphatase family protein [Aestuariispira ectoiniformans]